ncbi:hypothetical protein F5144DRAFT_595001 [Chaetomium tenue]|uniref:Uncharacterized protein n=1 Tax=Chaetomium tenue TaxID=1854479 RepID=A0ACB7NYK4_9PEZI|nr:hypothetical protein F5144DRAFT_595001 [Chaetomium globosum]
MFALRLSGTGVLVAVAMGLYAIYIGSLLLNYGKPGIPHERYNETTKELQTTCNAHGYLQLLVEYPSDPITVFEMLRLDPNDRPFFPIENSGRARAVWYQEVKDMVEQRYMKLMEITESARHRIDARGDGDEDKAFLPMLTATIRGKDRACMWPLAQEFLRKHCEATWAKTGLAALLQNKVLIPNEHCR